MKILQKQFILFLASPEVNSRDLDSFVEWLRGGGLEKSVDEAKRLRRSLREFVALVPDPVEVAAPDPMSTPASDSIVADVRRLIAGTPLAESRAVQLIGRQLQPGPLLIRPFNKAIQRLVEKHGAAAVLKAARDVRNKTAHGPDDHGWDLDKE